MPRDLRPATTEPIKSSDLPRLKSPSPDSKKPKRSQSPSTSRMEPDTPSRLQLVHTKSVDADIKPYVQALNMLDLESVLELQNDTVPEDRRLSREQVQHRFRHCGELSLGIFTSADTTDEATSKDGKQSYPAHAVTARSAVSVYSGTPDRKSVLLGHVIALKTSHPQADASKREYYAEGRTLHIDCFGVLNAFQHKGLGSMLLKSYVQRVGGSSVVDEMVLDCASDQIKFFEKYGFKKMDQKKTEGERVMMLLTDMQAS